MYFYFFNTIMNNTVFAGNYLKGIESSAIPWIVVFEFTNNSVGGSSINY